MAISTKTITMRQGNEADFQPSKMISGEMAIINDKEELHFAPQNGKTVRVATDKDIYDLKQADEVLKESIRGQYAKIEQVKEGLDQDIAEQYDKIAEAKRAADTAASLARAQSEQIGQNQEDIQQVTNANTEISNKLALKGDSLEYHDSTLSLMADGVEVASVEIVSGTGGGGGNVASSVVTLTNQNGTASLGVAPGNPVELKFYFASVENDIPTGDGVCQVTVNGAVKTTFSINQGLNSVDVAKYLASGSNTVRIKCTDVYGNYRTLIYMVELVDVYLTSTFDATVPYTGDITFKYTPYGSVSKTVYILVDGTEEAAIVTSLSGKQSTYVIPALPHGAHLIEAYVVAQIGENTVESEPLSYAVVCLQEGNNSPVIASNFSVESVEQGELLSIPYIVYDPTKLACDISLDIYTMKNGAADVYKTQELTVDRGQKVWNTRQYPVGDVKFRIKYGEIEVVHSVTVAENDVKVEPETNDLEMELLSIGRSNSEPEPEKWESGSVTTEFTKVNWDTTGWVEDAHGDTCLRLNGDARAEVKFQPFAGDIRTYGKTIEIEFAIKDVNKRDATVISCMADNIGFEIKADQAAIYSEQSNIFCKYKEEEKVKLAFVVESRSEYRLLSVYLNGIQSDVVQYPDNDSFQQTSPVNISIGSSECGVDIYSIRSYSTALTHYGAVNNFVADIPDVAEKMVAYERNDIYDDYNNISFEKCKQKNSVMVIVGDLPQTKGDKKTVEIQYYDLEDSTLNYDAKNVQLDIQGTSSQYYVRKNWKMKFNEEHYIDKTQLPTNVICIKVDYAEATGTHNTQNANFVETLYDEKVPAQEDNPKCRTTIYGKPILLFHQQDATSDPVFYGKANYNYDKGSEKVFGFTSNYDVECWEFKNNTSDACNFLGPIPTAWGDDFEARYPEESTAISRFRTMHNWVVATKGNVEKFKSEFEDHFDLHFSLIYYVYTFFALMVDQRAKNLFLTYWGKTGKWYPYFYDNDTSFGIDNEGRLIFDYFYEDTDTINDANVYNGQNSTLWANFREAYAEEIKDTYYELRSSGKLTYDKLVDRFITNGSDKWSESVYNEDSDFKYVSMVRTDNDASNLTQLRGSGEEHFRYFVENRLMYCDSKWNAPEYAADYVRLRLYTPATWTAVEPNHDITVKYYSDIYGAIQYTANSTIIKERVKAGEEITFEAPDQTFNNTETSIFGASQISSLGDLSALYCGGIVVDKADKLIELLIGKDIDGYTNDNLIELSVGTNKLLKRINVCNCPNLKQVLNLSGCPNIEEIYATGSGVTGVELSQGGCLKKAYLPAVANLTLRDQHYIEELTLEGYENIQTLWIENTPNVDGVDILSKAVNVKRLRLTDVNMAYDTPAEMLALAEADIAGIDENGINIDRMWIDGTCHIKNLTGAELLLIKEAFPYLTITYDALVATLIFMSEDGTTELARQSVVNGGDGSYTGTTPTKASTAQYTYTHSGWSLTPGGSADANALKNVEADRTVYAAFSATVRKYTVKFYNGTTLLQTVSNVPYGGSATYTGATPENNTTGNPDDFEFYGWNPSPTNIKGDTNCYAQFYDMREISDSWATIASNVANGTAESKYAVGAFKTLEIGAVDLPYDFRKGSAVVYNNEIHILGSLESAYYRNHYKWNGTEWISVSTLPYDFRNGSAVVYNNEIHIMGTYMSEKSHYKWDGTNWTSVSTLPYDFYYGSAVAYNNEIHILGTSSSSSYYKRHYKWNGTEWTSVSTLPYNFYGGSAVVYSNEIHIFGGSALNTYRIHYKWDGTEWTSVSTLSYGFEEGSAVVYNDEIHIIGSYKDNNYRRHSKWNGTEWTSVSTLPYDFYYGSAVVYSNEIYILGSKLNMNAFYRYSTEDSKWKQYITEAIPMQIVAHNHDDKADGSGKATLTFVAQNLLKDSRQWNTSGVNDGGYPESDLKDFLNGDFISTLPSDLQTALNEVTKVCDGGANSSLVSSNEKVWALSLEELGATSDYALSGQGETYSVFTDSDSRKRVPVNGNSIYKYWTRTTRKDNNKYVYGINNSGNAEPIIVSTENYILIGFCI